MFDAVSSTSRPLVSVIILNYNGLKFLPRCLETLWQTTYSPHEIVVVDNSSTDDSLTYLRKHHPDVRIISTGGNLGFSRAYNFVVPQISGKYIVLLNFDVEVEPDWLDEAIAVLEREPQVAAVQPKLKRLQDRRFFEYAGGSGGYIDRYGYPFVRGRIFDSVEEDHGQYDDIRPVFWATGAAFITRKADYEDAGGLDGDFFMHMEELDLCWRFWLFGRQVKVVPQGTVYHYSGAALAADRVRKMYYNHRNGLIMLLKNYSAASLWRNLPMRIALDWMTILESLASLKPKRALAVCAAHAYCLLHLLQIWRKRRQVQTRRTVRDQDLAHVIFPRSIVRRYFLRKQITYSQITASL